MGWRAGLEDVDRWADERDGQQHDRDQVQAHIDQQAAGHVLPEGVQEQDAHHRAQAGGSHDEEDVLRAQAQDGGGKARAQRTEHADDRGPDAQVAERPGDLGRVLDEGNPLSQLLDDVGDALRPASNGRGAFSGLTLGSGTMASAARANMTDTTT